MWALLEKPKILNRQYLIYCFRWWGKIFSVIFSHNGTVPSQELTDKNSTKKIMVHQRVTTYFKIVSLKLVLQILAKTQFRKLIAQAADDAEIVFTAIAFWSGFQALAETH
jgi:hypothetical protein